MLHKIKTLIFNVSVFSLPASVTTIGPCCCTMDAVSQAFSLEETIPRSMPKTYFYPCSFRFIYFSLEAFVLFSPLVFDPLYQCHVSLEAPR
jgi:hypothetical protein